MRRLAPGDLLTIRWLKLDSKPESSYLIVAAVDDRLAPEYRLEPTFWYYHPTTMKFHQMNVSTIDRAVEAGEFEVEVQSARESVHPVS